MNNLFSLRCLRSIPTPLPSTLRTLQQTRSFSSTPAPQARKRGGPKKDTRVLLIRYFLSHPLTPRPLRFSRNRYLRHWTIHRAWQLFKAQRRTEHERDLERQYQSMRDACEALRLMDSNGLVVVAENGKTTVPPQGKDVGRLYRVAMEKKDIWNGVPIEYARIQVDSPAVEGWNHAWTR